MALGLCPESPSLDDELERPWYLVTPHGIRLLHGIPISRGLDVSSCEKPQWAASCWNVVKVSQLDPRSCCDNKTAYSRQHPVSHCQYVQASSLLHPAKQKTALLSGLLKFFPSAIWSLDRNRGSQPYCVLACRWVLRCMYFYFRTPPQNDEPS